MGRTFQDIGQSRRKLSNTYISIGWSEEARSQMADAHSIILRTCIWLQLLVVISLALGGPRSDRRGSGSKEKIHLITPPETQTQLYQNGVFSTTTVSY